MKQLWIAIGFLSVLIAAVCFGGAQRKEHFAQDKEFDGRKLDRVIDDIYTNQFPDYFPYTDTARTDDTGWCYIYLPFKYANADYFVTATSTTVSLLAAVTYSDSSFLVVLYDYDGNGRAFTGFRYYVVGRKR